MEKLCNNNSVEIKSKSSRGKFDSFLVDSEDSDSMIGPVKKDKKKKSQALEFAKKIINGNFNMDMMNERFEDPCFQKRIQSLVSFIRRNQGNTQKVKRVKKIGKLRIWYQDKDTHLYIQGKSNSGKTTWAKKNLTNFYMAPKNNDWVGMSNDIEYIVFDEFSKNTLKNFPPENLNELMDGQTTLNIKGSSVRITNKPICVFLSQYKMEEVFSGEKLESFKNRCRQFKMEQWQLSELLE